MNDFKKRGGFGGGGSGRFDGKPRFNRPGNREFRQAQMFDTTCAECHKPCQVPFRPSGERPVYCSYCFGKNKAGGSNGGDRNLNYSQPHGNFNKPNFNSAPVAKADTDNSGLLYDLKKQLDAANGKLDTLMEYMKTHRLVVEKIPPALMPTTLNTSPKSEELSKAISNPNAGSKAVITETAKAVKTGKKQARKIGKKAVKARK